MKVYLMNWKIQNPIEAISHAALSCYQEKMPEWGKKINVENALFKTGHHTTMQHTDFSFFIEGISVGDVTFGLHLANPFYNTSQRSGRFCGKMFSNPNYRRIVKYLDHWAIGFDQKESIVNYVKSALNVYSENIQKATLRADEFIRIERPNANEKYRQQNAPKIAQEQLRVFVPIIFPTALEYTINLSVLTALYRSAWSPIMKEVTRQMANLVVDKWPELSFLFVEKRVREDVSVDFFSGRRHRGVLTKPRLHLVSKGDERFFVKPEPQDLHPVDLLHFLPKYMVNNVEGIKTLIEISVATMGQDQRHRTIRRSQPGFSGNFYLPPIPDSLGLKKEAAEILNHWLELSRDLPVSLATTLAPYGAMVKYGKDASYNAATHELGKRLCWCAQEEIYHLARFLRKQIGEQSPLLGMFTVPCVISGKCGEGARCCGRDLKKMENDPFPERRI
ncbi:MAG: FAD-dependent thymidylate synthase [Candidatus Pacebacteria bacterium]|nr:FAD-dependent thymidylate synthase [Candidatus Paceibacterota bacterium]